MQEQALNPQVGGGCGDGAGLNAPALVAFAAPRTRLISRTATCMCCSASHGNGPWDVGWVENLLGSLGGKDSDPIHLSYEPYYFSERIVSFSHNESANSTFSHGFSVKQTGPVP